MTEQEKKNSIRGVVCFFALSVNMGLSVLIMLWFADIGVPEGRSWMIVPCWLILNVTAWVQFLHALNEQKKS